MILYIKEEEEEEIYKIEKKKKEKEREDLNSRNKNYDIIKKIRILFQDLYFVIYFIISCPKFLCN